MNAIRITRVLCARGHCILGRVYPDTGQPHVFAEQDMIQLVTAAVLMQQIDPRCHICGSEWRFWTYKDELTQYTDLDEAQRETRKGEQEQRAAADMLTRASRLTQRRRFPK